MTSSSPQDRDRSSNDFEPSSLRDALLPASEITPDQRLSTSVLGFFTPARLVTILVIMAVLFLSWLCIWGPLSAPLEKALSNLALSLPAATATATPTSTL